MKKTTAAILLAAAFAVGGLLGDALVPKASAGACWGLKPLCGSGAYPLCICYDSLNTNCAWQCVRPGR